MVRNVIFNREVGFYMFIFFNFCRVWNNFFVCIFFCFFLNDVKIFFFSSVVIDFIVVLVEGVIVVIFWYCLFFVLELLKIVKKFFGYL